MSGLVWTLPTGPNQTARWEASSGGGGASSGVLVETTTLDNDQILGLYNTFVEVIPNPGPNKVNNPVSIAVWGDFAALYSPGGGGAALMSLINDPNQYDVVSSLRLRAADFNHTGTFYASSIVAASSGFGTGASTANFPTYLALDTDWVSGGDPANVATIVVTYTVIDV